MVRAERQKKRREHPMKDDRNRSAGPALGRVQRHADGVAHHHHREVDRSDEEQDGPEPSARHREEAALPDEAAANRAVSEDDEDLTDEELRIRYEPREPFFPRWQEGAITDRDQRLRDHSSDEQREDRRQHDGIRAKASAQVSMRGLSRGFRIW